MDTEQTESSRDDLADAVATEKHWTVAIGAEDRCANCGASQVGRFCSECGQKQLSHRLKFVDLAKSVLSQLVNLDRGLFHTFLDLLSKPGVVARDYVSGKQRAYVNPLSYFFIGAATQLIAFYFCKPVVVRQLRTNLGAQFSRNSPDLAEKLQNAFNGDPAAAIADCYISAIQQGYTYAALLFFCLPFAILLFYLHRLAGEKFRLGETFVFSLYCFAQILILTAFVNLFALRISSTLQGALALLTYAVYPLYAHSGFFQRKWSSRLMTMLAAFIASCIFFTSIILIFIGSVVATISFNASG